jgi:hypothetical protein
MAAFATGFDESLSRDRQAAFADWLSFLIPSCGAARPKSVLRHSSVDAIRDRTVGGRREETWTA